MQTGRQKLPGSLSYNQIVSLHRYNVRMHCLIHLSWQNVTCCLSWANPDHLNQLCLLAGQSQSKKCESGWQKNKPTLCPAAHLSSSGEKNLCHFAGLGSVIGNHTCSWMYHVGGHTLDNYVEIITHHRRTVSSLKRETNAAMLKMKEKIKIKLCQIISMRYSS